MATSIQDAVAAAMASIQPSTSTAQATPTITSVNTEALKTSSKSGR